MPFATLPFVRRPQRVPFAAFGFMLAGLVSLAAPASAQVWNEAGDAGPLPATAQATLGSGALTSITGTLPSATDVDMYCITVTDPASFYACLTCVVIQSPDLYLFDATGKGLAVAQICAGSCKQITPSFVGGAGTYYLAVAQYGSLAFAGPDLIWLSNTTFARAPDGPGAANAITSWGGSPQFATPINYQINLSGASFCSGATPTHVNSWGSLKLHYH
jgi:hypothetical protein